MDFAHVHVDCMKGYETQLASWKHKIHQAELAKAELDRKWSIEIDEAYQLCEVLQQEIDILCNSLEELRGRVDSGSKENDRKGKGEHKVANLSPKKVSWANDNCPRIQRQPSTCFVMGKMRTMARLGEIPFLVILKVPSPFLIVYTKRGGGLNMRSILCMKTTMIMSKMLCVIVFDCGLSPSAGKICIETESLHCAIRLSRMHLDVITPL